MNTLAFAGFFANGHARIDRSETDWQMPLICQLLCNFKMQGLPPNAGLPENDFKRLVKSLAVHKSRSKGQDSFGNYTEPANTL